MMDTDIRSQTDGPAEDDNRATSGPAPQKGISWLRLLFMQALVAVAVIICWRLFFDDGKNWQGVYDACDKSVVEVYTPVIAGVQSGTGFVFSFQGKSFVLTCAHVVSKGANSQIRFADQTEGTAQVVDASELHDIALLQVQGVNLMRYGELPQVRSMDLQIGEEVMTIGHPIRESHHLSVGFYTGKFTDKNGRTLLRLSMSVDPGNSGGPLLNRRGQVVGVISQRVEASASIAFAIPIEKIQYLSAAKAD